MRGRVGYWGSSKHGGFAVQFDDDMVRWLGGQATDQRVFVSVSRDRRVIVLPDIDGGHVNSKGDRLRTYVSSHRPDSLFMDIELPLFELTGLDFDEEEGCLSCQLPADHDLPWPNLVLDCETYKAEELAIEALQWRVNSLIGSGLTSFPSHNRMPQRLLRLLPAGTYAECIRTAKTLSGVS